MPLRPTPDALRERAFAVLGGELDGVAFLDLYAGTGAVGLEALSRGAGRVVSVEHHRAAARLIEDNRQALGVDEATAAILVMPARRAVAELARRGQSFGLIWADPPFEDWEDGLLALREAAELGVLAAGGTACLECPDDAAVAGDARLQVVRDLGGGASRLVLLGRR